MQLNELINNLGAKKKRTRLGRGIGSGKGKTAGRGVKGQKARSGVSIRWFEGGQMPLKKRLPKRGFNSFKQKKHQIISVDLIVGLIQDNVIDATKVITTSDLVALGIVKDSSAGVKLLSGANELVLPFTIRVEAFSVKAKDVVVNAGGQVL